MKGIRTNLSNTGKEAEKEIELTLLGYERKGLALLRKVDPPVRMVRGRVIFMRNPWPDYVGTLSSSGGRMLAIEVKSTKGDTLRLGADGGVTAAQVDSMKQWSVAGAVMIVLWRAGFRWHLLTMQQFARDLPHTLPSAAAHPIPPGAGLVLVDFLPIVRKLIEEGSI